MNGKIVSSTTNKNKKSFNFELEDVRLNKKSFNSNNKSAGQGKKLFNLTGPIPKGLLSPTNNINKHMHAQYFESATTLEN